MTHPIYHPELDQRRKTCTKLRSAIQDCILEWHRLTYLVRPRLLQLYHQAFGEYEITRQKLALQAAILFRRVELLTIKANRGEQITPETVELVNRVVDVEFARLSQRLESLNSHDDGGKKHSNSIHDEQRTELVKMYRVLAKKLHPDAGGKKQEETFWHLVQRAYRDNDVSQLRALLLITDVNTTSVQPDSLQDWIIEEQRLTARLRIEQRKLNSLLHQEPFTLQNHLEDDEWKSNYALDLQREIRAKEREIDEYRTQYLELTRGFPQQFDQETKRDGQDFHKDFFDNTYFGGR